MQRTKTDGVAANPLNMNSISGTHVYSMMPENPPPNFNTQQHTTGDQFNRQIAAIFNNHAVVPDSQAFTMTSTSFNDVNPPQNSYWDCLDTQEEQLQDPKEGVATHYYNSLRFSRASNRSSFLPQAENDLIEALIRVSVRPEKSKKRKSNIANSKRDTKTFPPGASRREINYVPGTMFEKIKTKITNQMTKKRSESYATNSSSEIPTEGGKHYTDIENVVLVGIIYLELFKNPALKKQTWKVIAENFVKFFKDHPNHNRSCNRSPQALERHFKVLKEQNRKLGQTMFMDYFQRYQAMK